MGSGAGSSPRDANLDLLRATAITMVVVYHLVQMSPRPMSGLAAVTTFGQYGVDLFFVLSGWLIGRLYWDEAARHGAVAVGRFWSRRALRTMPPYFAALAVWWVAVFIDRREPFDWAYLLFVQNYQAAVPFFVVSWSLCIEEHFYLVVPLILAIAGRSRRHAVGPLAALAVIAPLGRVLLSWNGPIPEFGYALTATHLRLEGLILGFALASLPVLFPLRFAAIRSNAVSLRVVGLALIAVSFALPPLWMYRVGLTLLQLGFLAVLLSLVGRPAGRVASSRIVQAVALASYSIYLTHALVLHAARRIADVALGAAWAIYFPIGLVLVIITGATFYGLVEQTSIALRDRLVPRRR